MKEQEVYVKVPESDATNIVDDQGDLVYVKELTALVFTPEEFESLAGEIVKMARSMKQVSWTETDFEFTTKEIITSLTNKKQ